VPEVSARDRKALVALVQQAQLVDAFGKFPKKQFMDRPGDQARIAARVIEMRKTAGELSAAFREQHADVPWDDLEALGRAPEELWRAARKITPKMLAELEPLLEGLPEAGFVMRGPPKPRKTASRPGSRRAARS
jgi:hypothetical protein